MSSQNEDNHGEQHPVTQPQKEPSLRGVVGIINLGNTCYANSTIQLIRAVPEINRLMLVLDDTLISMMPDEKTKPSIVTLAYQDLLKTIWSAYRPSYARPLGYFKAIQEVVKGTVYDTFGMPMQNDSHEYLVWLLDNFHEALNVNSGRQRPSLPSPAALSALSIQEQAILGWEQFTATNKSPIIKDFFGLLCQTMECQNCSTKSYAWHPFNVLKIPCDGETFTDWIASEFAPEIIDDYACAHCAPTRQKATLSRHIWHLPPVLFISLKRFTPNGRKIGKSCPYDNSPLRLLPFFAPASPHASRTWIYDLRGIVDHHGSHSGGHYSAQFRHPISDEWWWIDDESSQKLDSGPRLNQPSNYILLFRSQAAGSHPLII